MKSRLFRCLPSALLFLSMVLTGCATTGSSEAATSREHVHGPWRYKHMNHVHTRPWNKDQKPLVQLCSACVTAPKAR